jgi:hypothetical protein
MVTTNTDQTMSKYSSLPIEPSFVGWEEKFNQESEVVKGQIFDNGTQVQTRVSVHTFKGKLAFRTARSCHVDGRYVDTFYPTGLSVMMQNQLKDLGIRELEVQFKIVEQIQKDYIISCCLNYEVILLSILTIDEIVDIKKVQGTLIQSNFVVEGTILNFNSGRTDGYLTLQQEDGHQIFLNFNSYGIGYDTSVYEITFPVTPFVDDIVQAGIYYDVQMNKYIVNSLHLVQECELRQSKRKELAILTEQVCENLKTSIESSGLNELLSQNVDNSNRTLLNGNQIETIKQTIRDNQGEEKLPFVMRLKDCDLYEMSEIAKVYGKPNIYTMNLDQFLVFCEQVGCCQIHFATKGSSDYHLRYLLELAREGLVTNIQYARLLNLTIDSYTQRIKNKNYLTTDNIKGYTDNDYTFTHKYLLDQAIIYGSDVKSESLINTMLNLAQNAIADIEAQVNRYNGTKCEVDLRDQPTSGIANFFVSQFFTYKTSPDYLSHALPFLDFELKIDELYSKVLAYQQIHHANDSRLDHNITCMGYSLTYFKEAIVRIRTFLD